MMRRMARGEREKSHNIEGAGWRRISEEPFISHLVAIWTGPLPKAGPGATGVLISNISSLYSQEFRQPPKILVSTNDTFGPNASLLFREVYESPCREDDHKPERKESPGPPHETLT
jgi:hypothetical protein